MINFSYLNPKKIAVGTFFMMVFTCISFSQSRIDSGSSFWNNVQFGVGIGLNFGNGFFSGALAPNAVYRFSPYVATGVGLNFQYSSQRDVFQSTVVGASVLGLFNPYRALQISTEFEQLHVNRNFDEEFTGNLDDEYWYPALFLGLGYTSGNITFGIRYDVLYDDKKSIQPQAWMHVIRVWF